MLYVNLFSILKRYKTYLSILETICLSLEKEMATHSNILVWEIPRTEEFGGLQSMGLQKGQTWLSD